MTVAVTHTSTLIPLILDPGEERGGARSLPALLRTTVAAPSSAGLQASTHTQTHTHTGKTYTRTPLIKYYEKQITQI